ncbi:protein FAR1-RELATED SEQUENCE 5-like [Humulus lupulus]|uniref:protein FAR1-RELATED SEQUENCE 5-like n=1 Tax=Humulus lupulus TaxID=3486 RepID=UPI002B40DBDC|nr:protein FAR1-RELATED SEQUENCE 5-like [Humulus lupulus]
MGFSKRSDDVKRRDGVVFMRRWVCSNEGYRRKEYLNMPNRKKRPKPITCTGCQAALRVVRLKDNNIWLARVFSYEHNHDMVSVAELQFLRSNREVSDGLPAQVRSMSSIGIKTSQIMSHVALQSGGYERILLTKKNRLANVFWEDETSRNDYIAFGDVIAFDTTYMTNTYNKPLFILMGVNHHFSTYVFGFALLVDETVTTYSWMLRVFLRCHNNKKLLVVLTDGDNAMQGAMRENLPESTHRLCAWHLTKNAFRAWNDPGFTKGFVDLMYTYYLEEVFLNKWNNLIETYQMEDSEWCQLQCIRRRMWAETYLHGQFVAEMRTTQQCESMNFCFKKILLKRYTLREFITAIDLAVTKMRHIERQHDYMSKHTLPQLPDQTDALRIYYEQCSKFYT